MAKANILLVEDDTVQTLETKNYLENSGYEVIVAANGKSALKAAKTQQNRACGAIDSDAAKSYKLCGRRAIHN